MSLDQFDKSTNASLHFSHLANWETLDERFVVEEMNKLCSSQEVYAVLSHWIYYTLPQEFEIC